MLQEKPQNFLKTYSQNTALKKKTCGAPTAGFYIKKNKRTFQ